MRFDDTIFALSSGALPAAIGVIRVSGPQAAAAIERLAGTPPASRTASLRTLSDPRDGTALDRALVLLFPGPATATGEDLAELHIHGSRAVAAAVLAALGTIDGLRAAEAGEFTRRAFANGVLDLDAAEGLADLLAAETEAQRRNALAMAVGAVGRLVAGWQVRLIDAAARVEAMLDFSDEGDVPDNLSPVHAALHMVAAEIDDMIARPPAERLREGVRVVVAGPPNAGKSTLVNALAGRDVAIVSGEPGTTRDIVEAPLLLHGAAITLADTAGLRTDAGSVERIGIDRAQVAMADADILLWLGDVDAAPQHKHRIDVYARSDVRPVPIGPRSISLSAHTGEGIQALIDTLVRSAGEVLPRQAELAMNARQRSLLVYARNAIADHADDPLLIAENIRLALSAFDRITGRAGVEDVLDALFGRFCIGK